MYIIKYLLLWTAQRQFTFMNLKWRSVIVMMSVLDNWEIPTWIQDRKRVCENVMVAQILNESFQSLQNITGQKVNSWP